MSTRRLIVLAAALLSPWTVIANGGPVAWTPATATGDVVPRKVTKVRLVSEQLRISLDPDGNRYGVEARYVLHNATAKAVRVNYGVPLSWPNEAGLTPGPADAARYPESIEIAVAEVRVRCALVETAVVLSEGLAPSRSVGWCIAALSVPAGTSTLTLRYPGALKYGDEGISSDPFPSFGPRILEYELTPASGWAGPMEMLEITLDAGRWADRVVDLAPRRWRREGTQFVWQLSRPDLERLRAVRATVHSERAVGFRERMGMPTIPVAARASSVLAPQARRSYEAAHAVDGDPATAWCAARRGAGIGEWIEISGDVQDERARYCGLWAVLVPGYARDQRTWDANNRVRSVRLGPCGREGGERLVKFEPPARAEEGYVDLERIFGEGRMEFGPACVRITIADVVAGTSADTCISEVRPVFCQ